MMTHLIAEDGTRATLRLPDMIVTSEYLDESAQPWGGEACYRYLIRVSARTETRGKGEYVTHAYGSQHDYANGDNAHAEEMAWLVLHELLDAYYDADEFLQMALGEPDTLSTDRVRGVLKVIDYAEKIAQTLMLNETEIRDGYEGT